MPEWHQRFARFYEEVLRAHAQTSSKSLTATQKLFDRRLASDIAELGVSLKDVIERSKLDLDLRMTQEQDLGVESDDSVDEEGADQVDGEGTQLTLDSEVATEARLDALLISEVRAARKIQRTQTQDPYNRETTVGGPILRIRKSDRLICGPILYWDVDVEYDPGRKRLTISKRSDFPELNTLILDPFLEEGEDIGAVVEETRQHLLSENFGISSLRQVLKVISGLVDALDGLEAAPEVDEPLRRWLRTPLATEISINQRAVLVNTPKSNAHLLDDLRKLAELTDPSPGGPLDLLTRFEDAPVGAEPRSLPFSFSDSAGGTPSLYFPFESNPAQRRIAGMAESARILTVQGPPGTGKSHTIANLVCHLASTGHTVLVTSHQRKAIEVVTDLLEPLRGLALSVAGGDRASSQELGTRIEAFLEDQTLREEAAQEEV